MIGDMLREDNECDRNICRKDRHEIASGEFTRPAECLFEGEFRQAEEGKIITKTMEDLEAMAGE